MAMVLGVDAGGTKAIYALAKDGVELARVRGGCIKRMRVDALTAEANLDAALAELVSAAGVPLDAVTRTCIGTAGESVPLVSEWLLAAFRERVGGEIVLVGDVDIALDAAFAGGPGVLVLAGTGSNVAARLRDGSVLTAGGWGPLLGDEGSGYRIASEGLRAMFRALDEGRETQLLKRALHHWSLGGVHELVAFVHAQPAPDLPPFAEQVVAAAAAGDTVAEEVLRSQGGALGQVVLRLLRRAVWDGELRVAFAGSIMEHVEPVRAAAVEVIRQEYPQAEFSGKLVDPVRGALWIAQTRGIARTS